MLLWNGRVNSKANPRCMIKETSEISAVLKECRYNTFVLLDLDKTVHDASQELGGDAWFVDMHEHARQVMPDQPTMRRAAVVELYHLVQHYTLVKPVEENTVRIIRLLQDMHIPVIALTSRGKEIIQPTLRQLAQIGVDFSRNWDDLQGVIRLDESSPAIFREGVIFCSGSDKGVCLDMFFKYLKEYAKSFPAHVVMMDDARRHLEAVEKVVAAHGCDFTGLRYGRLDEKTAQWNRKKAIKQLHTLSAEQFTEQQQALLATLQIPPASPSASPRQTYAFFTEQSSSVSREKRLLESNSKDDDAGMIRGKARMRSASLSRG
ncbi:MAG: hypothetical protein A3E83_01515 [Gammaproteobacteria bacterium RIFCSPHIGHO2_12_FULL_41_20]|nr:MAG: hypothetical protein A3E83_01515 [Gammaproteobacteria bacterium RIFCSPHIGHO2_12_FULL_41_20]